MADGWSRGDCSRYRRSVACFGFRTAQIVPYHPSLRKGAKGGSEIPNGADGSPFVASARSIWNVDLAVFRSRHRLQAKLRAPHVPAESPDAAWHTGNRTPVSGYPADKWNLRIRIAPTAGLGIAAKPITCKAVEITLAHATWVIFLRPSDSRERTPVANTCQSA